jgi:DNA-directed RNA polymerase subunit RPC12/RpoP
VNAELRAEFLRRAERDPIAAYLGRIAADYGPPAPAVLQCHQCGRDVEFWLPDEDEELQVECGQCGQSITIRSAVPP